MINNIKKSSLAKTISYCTEAPFLAIIVFLIFNFFLDSKNFLIIESISLLFGTIFPILYIIIWSKVRNIDIDYSDKKTRDLPFLITSIIYFIGALILWILKANYLTNILMLCYGTNTLFVFLINLKWKISVHAIGTTGPTTALLFFNPLGFLLGLLTPLVMWSRVTLKKHTYKQVLVGAIFGHIITFIQIYILLNIANIKININLITTILIGLIILSIITYLILKRNNEVNF